MCLVKNEGAIADLKHLVPKLLLLTALIAGSRTGYTYIHTPPPKNFLCLPAKEKETEVCFLTKFSFFSFE
uniref:Putative secreted protein n=1 Tax=Rhipicephalus microplus TaxID=6941 RepID=A0A6M2DF76_RHIMP